MTRYTKLFLAALIPAVAACQAMPTAVAPPMTGAAPQVAAMAKEARYPAFVANSKSVPLKYDNRGRLGRLCLNFKARFAGVVPDETMVWEVNGGEKRSGFYAGFNSLMYPAQDGKLYVIDQPLQNRSTEFYYPVGTWQKQELRTAPANALSAPHSINARDDRTCRLLKSA